MIIAIVVLSMVLAFVTAYMVAIRIRNVHLENDNDELRSKVSELSLTISQNEQVIGVLTAYTQKKIKKENHKKDQKDVNEYDTPEKARESKSDS